MKIRMKKACPEDTSIPCLMCEQVVKMEILPRSVKRSLADIKSANFEYGVGCITYGNYGSQVWDGNGCLNFVICDECIIRNSHKMIMNETRGEFLRSPRNARDYYDTWFSWLTSKRQSGDTYYERISKYFRERVGSK